MSIKAVSFSNGSRAISFELNSSSDVSGIGGVFTRFLEAGEIDVDGVVQAWDNRLCGIERVPESGERRGCSHSVCGGSLGHRCVSCGELFARGGEPSVSRNAGTFVGSNSCAAGSLSGSGGVVDASGAGYRSGNAAGTGSGVESVDSCGLSGGSVTSPEQVPVSGFESCGVNVSSQFVEVGANTLRNRATRKLRSERKKQRKGSGFDWRVRGSSELNKTLEDKWKVENELATERARRQLEVLKANDVEQEVKRYRTKVSAATEKNMVSIEKTHAMLSATGNIPGVFHGSAETVVSGEPGLTDGSISPNSSASMAEFRACQKSLLDSQSENADLKRKMQLMSERFGFPMQHADYIDKRTWTDNEENDLILGDMYPDGYGMNTMFMPEGKFRPC